MAIKELKVVAGLPPESKRSSECPDRCLLEEHKGYYTCYQTGKCEWKEMGVATAYVEQAYSGASFKQQMKDPVKLANFLIQSSKSKAGKYGLGALKDMVIVALDSLGLKLLWVNKIRMFKASALMLKKGYTIFLLGQTKILVCRVSSVNWKKVPQAQSLTQMGTALKMTTLESIFAAFTIPSKGNVAFFQLMAKMEKRNKNMEKTGAVMFAALLTKDNSIPYLTLKTVGKVPVILNTPQALPATKEIKGIDEDPDDEDLEDDPFQVIKKVKYTGPVKKPMKAVPAKPGKKEPKSEWDDLLTPSAKKSKQENEPAFEEHQTQDLPDVETPKKAKKKVADDFDFPDTNEPTFQVKVGDPVKTKPAQPLSLVHDVQSPKKLTIDRPDTQLVFKKDDEDTYKILHDLHPVKEDTEKKHMVARTIASKLPMGLVNQLLTKGGVPRFVEEWGEYVTDPLLKKNPPADKGGVAYSIVNRVVSGWAASSTNADAINVQMAVAKLAKIKDSEIASFVKKFGPSFEEINGTTQNKYAQCDYRVSVEIAKAMYTDTQAFFAKAKIKEVRLFRGFKMNEHIDMGGKTIIKGSISINPLSSFSTNYSTANGFGSYMIGCVVPVERIFSTPHTGFGCDSEFEFVVIGGRINAFVINGTRFHQAIKDKTGTYAPSSSVKNFIEEGLRGAKMEDLLTKFYQSPESVSVTASNEPKMYADGGDNADWIKQGLDVSLPKIGTRAFDEYLEKSGMTFEQVLQTPAYRMAHIKYAPVHILLQKMAMNYDPVAARVKVKPLDEVKQSLCHLTTVEGLECEKNPRNKIWFFGHTGPGHAGVYHSLLTDQNDRILANNYHGIGNDNTRFDPAKGYKYGGENDWLPILDVVPVSEFKSKFFKAGVE